MSEPTLHLRGSRPGGCGPRHPWLPPERPDWMTDPARRCSPDRADWEMWTSSDKWELGLAARLCRSQCPFLQQCRAWAVKHGEAHFAWGGMVLSRAKDYEQAHAEREAAA